MLQALAVLLFPLLSLAAVVLRGEGLLLGEAKAAAQRIDLDGGGLPGVKVSGLRLVGMKLAPEAPSSHRSDGAARIAGHCPTALGGTLLHHLAEMVAGRLWRRSGWIARSDASKRLGVFQFAGARKPSSLALLVEQVPAPVGVPPLDVIFQLSHRPDPRVRRGEEKLDEDELLLALKLLVDAGLQPP